MPFSEIIRDFYNSELSYYEGFNSFCYQNCIRLLLGARKVRNPELYINCSMSLLYEEDKASSALLKSHSGSRCLIPEYSPLVQRHYHNLKDDSLKIFSENMKMVLKSGLPMIVGADTFYLPYAINYKKNHAIHTLLLCGYNSAYENVYIVDWYSPWYFKGTVKLEEFINARNSTNPYDGTVYSGMPILNNWAVIEGDNPDKTPLELLKIQLGLSVEQYYTQVRTKEFQGIQALERFFKSIMDVKDYKTECKKLHDQLYVAIKRHELFRQFLVNVNMELKMEPIGKIANGFDEIISMWDIVLMLITKLELTGNEKTKERLRISFARCLEKEFYLGEQVLNLYHNI